MSVTDLLYRLRADGTQLTRELKRGSKQFDSFGKRARATLGKIGGLLAGSAITGGVAKFTQDAINGIDRLQKFADTAGLAAEDIAGIQLAADLGGQSIERVVDGIGDLSQKMDQGADIFDRYKINVRDTTGALRPTIDVVKDIADEIQKLGPGAQATSLAMQTFGGAGRELLPTLLQGADGIERMREEADRLGLTFDEKTGRAAEEFNDNLTRMNRGFQGIFRRLASDILPILNSYSRELLQSSTQTGTLTRVSKGLAGGLRVLLSVAEGVAFTFAAIGTTIGAVGAVFAESVTGFVKEASESFGALGRSIKAVMEGDFTTASQILDQNLDGMVERAQASQGRLRNIWEQWGADIESLAFSTGHRIEAIWDDTVGDSLTPPPVAPPRIPKETTDAIVDDMTALAEIVAKAYDEAVASEVQFLERLKNEGRRVFEQTRTPLEAFNIEMERLSMLLNFGAIDVQTYLRAVDDLTEGLNRARQEGLSKTAKAFEGQLSSSLDDVGAKLEEADARLQERVNQITTAVEDIVSSGVDSIFDSWTRDLEGTNRAAAEMLRTLVKIASQALITRLAGAAVGGGAAPGFAEGGLVHGPGTATSDSIFARLSRGEFVIREAAVDRYGPKFFESLNNLETPRFANGGQVGGGGDLDGMRLTIANLFSEEELERFMSSRRGERVLRNVIRRQG